MSAALQFGASLCVVLAIVCGAAVLVRTRDVGTGVHVLLEFLLAAGLLRLADSPTWRGIVVTAVIVTLRRVLSSAVMSDVGTTRTAGRRH